MQKVFLITGALDAVFTVDDVVLSSRLVEGRFPNYQQLLPESYEHELRVRRDELLEVFQATYSGGDGRTRAM